MRRQMMCRLVSDLALMVSALNELARKDQAANQKCNLYPFDQRTTGIAGRAAQSSNHQLSKP